MRDRSDKLCLKKNAKQQSFVGYDECIGLICDLRFAELVG